MNQAPTINQTPTKNQVPYNKSGSCNNTTSPFLSKIGTAPFFILTNQFPRKPNGGFDESSPYNKFFYLFEEAFLIQKVFLFYLVNLAQCVDLQREPYDLESDIEPLFPV